MGYQINWAVLNQTLQRTKPHAVYRFVCPDGRSYVGSCVDVDARSRYGRLGRSNLRLREVFDRHPPETWKFQILERLPLGATKAELRAAEQQHVDRLRSWDPAHGFNVFPRAARRRSVASGCARVHTRMDQGECGSLLKSREGHSPAPGGRRVAAT